MNDSKRVRKLHDDMRLLEIASNCEPDDTLVLIKVHFDDDRGTEVEIACSTPEPGITRRGLQTILSEAYRLTTGNGKRMT